jgi:hypothetical protein
MIFTRHGEVWLRKTMPPQLLAQARQFFFASPNRKYIFMLVGLHTNGARQVLEAMSFADSTGYRIYAESLPLTINHHTHTAVGVLAPRFGLWQIQVLPAECRGKFGPGQWKNLSELSDYLTAKDNLIRLISDEKKKHVLYQRIFRLKLRGPVSGHDADLSYHIPPDYLGEYFP